MRCRHPVVLLLLYTVTCCSCLVTVVSAEQRFVAFTGQMRDENTPKSVPALLNYQGYLATADSGLVNGTLAMTFRMFDSETKGAELWSEPHPAVEVSNGQFFILLGSETSFPPGLFDGSILYLQMEVGTEVFSPRKAIVSVAYSQMADEADPVSYTHLRAHET